MMFRWFIQPFLLFCKPVLFLAAHMYKTSLKPSTQTRLISLASLGDHLNILGWFNLVNVVNV